RFQSRSGGNEGRQHHEAHLAALPDRVPVIPVWIAWPSSGRIAAEEEDSTVTKSLPERRDFGLPPSLAEMEAIAYQELTHIPEELRRHCVGLAVRLEDFAHDDVLADMGIESPFDLMGLYQGIPLTRQSTHDIRHQPDMVFLYRRAILDYW